MKEIIDKYLDEFVSIELNKLPEEIVDIMADPNQDQNDEWKTWFPIPSQVNDFQIEEFELTIGHKLPNSFKDFLKYKHFYELHIGNCSFCEHPAGIWKSSLLKVIYDGHPREFLIDKGRIPFADWSDWGLLCFDTTIECQNHDYPIVLWDHEVFDEFEYKFSNFESMLIQLDKDNASQQ